jgi:5-methylcytosine-specific restriction endonuclease McrA
LTTSSPSSREAPTARNIELLCETCNRSKGSRIRGNCGTHYCNPATSNCNREISLQKTTVRRLVIVKLVLKHPPIRLEPVLKLESAKTYPHFDAALLCIRVYEYGKPYHDLRSFGINVVPAGESDSTLFKAYALTLRNAARLRRFRAAVIADSPRVSRIRGTYAKRLNTTYQSLLVTGKQLQESLIAVAGSPGLPDPLIPLPLYAPTDFQPEDFLYGNDGRVDFTKWYRRREVELQMSPSRHLTGTVFEPRRYFLYREMLWSVAQDEIIEQSAESIDRALRPKEVRHSTSRKGIPETVRVFVWRRYEGKCTRCGSRKRLEFDHIIPVVEGGSDTARNIELLCETCNRSKGSRIQ